MGINLHTMLYLQDIGALSPEKNKLLDIGPQNVHGVTSELLRQFISVQGQVVSNEHCDGEVRRLSDRSIVKNKHHPPFLSDIADLTSIEYNSFDVSLRYKTELLDLNFDNLPEKYHEYYDVVLNCGTTEHILNQWNCFEVIHDATRVSGIMYHQLPATGYLDHGYFAYTPLFFKDLAAANDYEVVDMFYTLAGFDEPLRMGIDVREETTLRATYSKPLTVFERRVPCFDTRIVLRKQHSTRFRCRLEVATGFASVDRAMALRYTTESKPRRDLDEARRQLDELGHRRGVASFFGRLRARPGRWR